MALTTYPINQGGRGAVVKVVPDSGAQFSKMSDGTLRGWTDYEDTVFRLTVDHFWLETADANAIKADYDNDPFGERTVNTELEGSFTATYLNRPVVIAKSGPLLKIRSTLEGTLNS